MPGTAIRTTSPSTRNGSCARTRILAGFNVIVLAGVLALGIGQVVATFQSAWWAVVPASLIAFLVVHWLLTTFGPLNARPGVHVVAWVLVAALAVLASPPVGLLVITGAIISTWGRRYVRLKATQPARSLPEIRSLG